MDRKNQEHESVHDHVTELDDGNRNVNRDIGSSAERDSRVDRDSRTDQHTTDYSQDVMTEERIETNAASYDNAKAHQELEAAKRDRSHLDADLNDERKKVADGDAFQLRQLDKDSTFVSDLREMRLRHLEDLHEEKMNNIRLHRQLELKMWDNILSSSEAYKNQDRRHVDHTLADEHPTDRPNPSSTSTSNSGNA